MYYPPGIVYIEKLAVGPEGKGHVSLELSVAENIRALASAKNVDPDDITVVVLDRDRHAGLIQEIRDTGARIKMISDGDIAGSLMAAMPDTGVDLLLGIGGSPEAVTSACALKCLGGDIQCRLWPRNDGEREAAEKLDLPLTRVLSIDDLVKGDDVFLAHRCTHGELVQGVQYIPHGATTRRSLCDHALGPFGVFSRSTTSISSCATPRWPTTSWRRRADLASSPTSGPRPIKERFLSRFPALGVEKCGRNRSLQ